MEPTALIRHLTHEYGLLTAALAAADPDVRVPSCPEWTAADLADHVAHVYQHKAEAMRQGAMPDPWPPAEPPTLAGAYAAMMAEFATREPEEATATWYEPEQTVLFWIRRMALETAMHRVDAELVAGGPVTPVAPDLAAEGIDEVLRMFLPYGVEVWPEDYESVLTAADPRPVLVATGGRGWLVAPAESEIAVTEVGPDASAAATVTGEPGEVYRWLWNRGGSARFGGDESLAAALPDLLAPSMR